MDQNQVDIERQLELLGLFVNDFHRLVDIVVKVTSVWVASQTSSGFNRFPVARAVMDELVQTERVRGWPPDGKRES